MSSITELNWVFDGDGEWSAVSQIMDPEMVDEPAETWCREWCLSWHIKVMEDGTFCASESDKMLLEDKSIARKCYASLSTLQAAIDLAEETLRHDDKFIGGKPIVLLPEEKYRT